MWILTGQLLEITNGILVLLGISGGASLTAKITAISKQERQRKSLQSLGLKEARHTKDEPKWADLISVDREFNLLKFQMLLFTLLAAAYVVLTVMLEQRFPTLPDNLLLLMGISNGVYLGGKMSAPTNLDQIEVYYRELQTINENIGNNSNELEGLKEKQRIADENKDTDEKKKEISDKIKEVKGVVEKLETEMKAKKDAIKTLYEDSIKTIYKIT